MSNAPLIFSHLFHKSRRISAGSDREKVCSPDCNIVCCRGGDNRSSHKRNRKGHSLQGARDSKALRIDRCMPVTSRIRVIPPVTYFLNRRRVCASTVSLMACSFGDSATVLFLCDARQEQYLPTSIIWTLSICSHNLSRKKGPARGHPLRGQVMIRHQDGAAHQGYGEVAAHDNS